MPDGSFVEQTSLVRRIIHIEIDRINSRRIDSRIVFDKSAIDAIEEMAEGSTGFASYIVRRSLPAGFSDSDYSISRSRSHVAKAGVSRKDYEYYLADVKLHQQDYLPISNES